MPNITLNVFGAFRNFLPGEQVAITLPDDSTIQQLRDAVRAKILEKRPDFVDDGLLDCTAFADDKTVLPEDTTINSDITLSLIPPVAGG